MVNTEIRLILFFAAKDGEALYSQQKRPGVDCGSDHELLITKFRLKLKKVRTHPILLGCSSALSALFHALNLDCHLFHIW